MKKTTRKLSKAMLHLRVKLILVIPFYQPELFSILVI